MQVIQIIISTLDHSNGFLLIDISTVVSAVSGVAMWGYLFGAGMQRYSKTISADRVFNTIILNLILSTLVFEYSNSVFNAQAVARRTLPPKS